MHGTGSRVKVFLAVVGDGIGRGDGTGGRGIAAGVEVVSRRPIIFALTDIGKTYYGYGCPVVSVG